MNACSSSQDATFFDVRLKTGSYSEFVDHFYQFSSRHRLDVLWFGWYRVDEPSKWYESSEETNFKIKGALLDEENGSIFVYSTFTEGVVRVSIDCGSRKNAWARVVDLYIAELEGSEKYDIPNSKKIDCEREST